MGTDSLTTGLFQLGQKPYRVSRPGSSRPGRGSARWGELLWTPRRRLCSAHLGGLSCLRNSERRKKRPRTCSLLAALLRQAGSRPQLWTGEQREGGREGEGRLARLPGARPRQKSCCWEATASIRGAAAGWLYAALALVRAATPTTTAGRTNFCARLGGGGGGASW